MTSPDLQSLYGLGSAAGQQELASFNSIRDQVMQSLMQRSYAWHTNVAQPVAQALGTQSQPVTPPPQGSTQSQVLSVAPGSHPSAMTDDALLGAAKFWGIPEDVASQMPRDQLEGVVQHYRTSAQPAEQHMLQRAAAEPWMLGSMALSAATGAGEAVVGGVQHLPIIGEAISRIHAVHAADQWLHSVDEGLRASNPSSFSAPVFGGQGDANTSGALGLGGDVGGFAALAAPIAGTWAMMGKVAGGAAAWSDVYGATWGPIARAAGMASATAFALGGRWLTEPVTEIAKHAIQTGKVDLNDPYYNQYYQELFHGSIEQNAAMVMGGAGEHVMQTYGPQLQALAERVFGKVGPQQPPSTGGSPFAGGQQPDMSGLSDVRGRPYPNTGADLGSMEIPANVRPPFDQVLTTQSPSDSHILQLRAMASNGDAQAQQMLDYISGGPQMHIDVGQQVDAAEAHATQINKAVQAVQGPALPGVASASNPDDFTIAQASMANNPGGVNVVQGVLEPQKLVEQLGANVQFVQHGTRLDALISDQPITPSMVDEYHQHGFFTGQSALLPNGVEGYVTGIYDGLVSVKPAFGGAEFYVKPEDIMPRLNSAHAGGGEALWNDFNDYANQRTGATASAMGNALTPDQLFTVRTQNTPGYMSDWFQARGITDPSEQARVRSFFNVKYVDGLKELVPQDFAAADAAQATANAVPPATSTPLGRIDKLAASKGFVVLPEGATGGYTVQELSTTAQQSPMSVSFTTREAAEAWIKTVDPQRMDLTPPSTVPTEIITSKIPTEPMYDTTLNPHQFESGVKAIAETTEPPQGIPDYASVYGPRAQLLRQTGKLEQMQNEYTRGVSQMSFISSMFRDMDAGLRNAGLDLGIEDARQRILQASDLMHNWESPHLADLAGINSRVRPSLFESGEYFRVYQMQDEAARLAEAQRIGMTPDEIGTFEQRAQKYREFFADNPTLAQDPQREVANYMSWVTKRQSTMGSVPQSWDEFAGLTDATQPFFEYTRGSDMNISMREVDPRILDRMYVRSLAWKKYMDPVYPGFAQQFKQIGTQVPELSQFTDVVGNWMKVVKYGYRAEQDRGAAIIHSIAQLIMGKEVTQQQAMHVFGGLMNNTYNSLLGFQPHILARDGLRLLFALPKVGTDLGAVMTEYAASPKARQEMWDFAYKNGISRTSPPMLERPFPYGEEPMLSALDRGANPDPQGWRMRLAENVSTKLADVMPAWFRDPTPTPLSPMYWVGKQAETMRMWVGNAMYRRTTGAMEDFLASSRDDAAVNKLLGDSGVRTMRPATQDTFMKYVSSGDIEGAKVYASRQMTDDTMFRYGSLETPMAMRSTFGRLGMQMGNFAHHVWTYTYDGLTNGSVGDRVKFGAAATATFAGLGAMSDAVGWDFNKMNPYVGAGFSGGPWLEPAMQLAAGVGAVIHNIGNDPSQQDAQTFSNAGQALGSIATMMNPMGGVIRSGERVYNAMQSQAPATALARAWITGEPGVYQDYAAAMGPQAQQMMQNIENAAQPMPNPYAATRVGVPQAPPMPAYYPPGIYTQPNSGPQQPPQVVPMPGGQPYAPRPAAGSPGPLQGPPVAPFPNPGWPPPATHPGAQPPVYTGPHGAQQ